MSWLYDQRARAHLPWHHASRSMCLGADAQAGKYLLQRESRYSMYAHQ